ncbi:FAD-dependent monooxygenase [Pedobacter sp. L105]|uniref:FAD-dependent monooxygenase n=1 Tax=Pedobacter sp. L105 TaxID=1641871 RepID=UPI00131CF63E|nr:FAD-dependent monooxygenase [Pedobacter sp. L105]
MKVVVIGGGIAGLCIGIYLHKNNIDVSVNEKQVYTAVGGHAFLMHHDGAAVLKEIAAGSDCFLPGKLVNTFVFKDPDGQVIIEQKVEDWQCFKRTDLLECLTALLPQEHLKNDRVFSHFVYEGEKIVAASFLNGELEYGDIFIGADGANSAVRQQIFGAVKFVPGKVKELVGVVKHPELALSLQGKFTKFQHRDKGLSFGLIPTSAQELVWFMQYDPALGDVPEGVAARESENYPHLLKRLCLSLLKDFPAEVAAVLSANDFRTSYIWKTRDFDLLPDFHDQNVVLIGDAAHVALPFTSAGTTNAMMDAKILCECLLLYKDQNAAFSEYYRIRSGNIASHVKLGRQLRDDFLNPHAHFIIPLIQEPVK